MKLLVQLYGIEKSKEVYDGFVSECPDMHEDWYVRQVIRTLNN